MQDTRYAFPVASIRVKESSLFDQAELEQLISVPTFDAGLAFLSEHGWDIPAGKPDSNRILRNELIRAWDFLCEIAPDISLLYPLIIRKDFHNLKAGIKSSLSGFAVDTYFLSPTTIEYATLIDAITQRHFINLPEPFASVAEEAYDVLARTGDGQLADIIIDQATQTHILSLAKDTKQPLVLAMSELFGASANIKAAFRAAKTEKNESFLRRALSECDTLDKNMLVSSASRGIESLMSYLSSTIYEPGTAYLTTKPSDFEKWCDDQGVMLLEKAKYLFFGPEPLIAYYFSKEAEIKNVRIILAAKENHLSSDIIRSRLRRLYV